MPRKSHVHEGDLATTNFPSLMYSILKRKDTGVLTISDGKAEKSVYIQQGRPVFAASNMLDDRLGQIFLRQGLVSIRHLIESVDETSRGDKRVGTILVEKELIKPHDLVQGVLTQVRNIIGSLFLWTTGRYSYAQGSLPSEEVITLKLNAGQIILEGVRRIESWERIWDAVGDLSACYQRVEGQEDGAAELHLTPGEQEVLALCGKKTTLGDLCDGSREKDYEIYRLIWALRTLGIVKRI